MSSASSVKQICFQLSTQWKIKALDRYKDILFSHGWYIYIYISKRFPSLKQKVVWENPLVVTDFLGSVSGLFLGTQAKLSGFKGVRCRRDGGTSVRLDDQEGLERQDGWCGDVLLDLCTSLPRPRPLGVNQPSNSGTIWSVGRWKTSL